MTSTSVTQDIADFKTNTMITFNKINEIQAEVLAEDYLFGILEKHTTGYKLFVLNTLVEFTEAEGKHIKDFCEKLYVKERARQRRTFIKEHKLRNSILKGDFNILA